MGRLEPDGFRDPEADPNPNRSLLSTHPHYTLPHTITTPNQQSAADRVKVPDPKEWTDSRNKLQSALTVKNENAETSRKEADDLTEKLRSQQVLLWEKNLRMEVSP